jgi:2-polyprenyl-3-methyl-5-hydroxy-6-metoxy-1,4-benzoquinol methylase
MRLEDAAEQDRLEHGSDADDGLEALGRQVGVRHAELIRWAPEEIVGVQHARHPSNVRRTVSERQHRPPTSHERRAGQTWDASYRDGPAPWDTGLPQPAIVRLAAEGAFSGTVLDAGCGTGENALHLASLGLDVLGVDVAETALSIARETAAARGIDAAFETCDAFHLDRLGRVFDTALDCGLFHSFDDDERREYVASLASVTRPGAALFVLCFCDAGGDAHGPHPVSQEELREAFTRGGGWHIASISPARLQTRFAAQGSPAWLVKVKRRPGVSGAPTG